eukprot:TRINITY_DN49489_c0_g4_i1.p2 TRINITY_DN49489_c0_g4~~TRINITY_DN49489_c0_g4_i1.p2  ORF type:complete len:157 (-),score=44.80 TRINITY_DN49489_c0_g4_i1:65-535(-)
MRGLSAVFIALFAFVAFASGNELARGWGDEIEWLSLEVAQARAATENKPIFLLIHKTWCGACKRLKQSFPTSAEIVALSKNFLMVNTEDDEEPKDAQFSPDGGYIPRILYVDPAGKVRNDLLNVERKGGSYLYFYPTAEQVVAGMKAALAAFPKAE